MVSYRFHGVWDDKVTAIDIDYVSGDVTLNGSDTDKVSVKETANKDLDDAHILRMEW